MQKREVRNNQWPNREQKQEERKNLQDTESETCSLELGSPYFPPSRSIKIKDWDQTQIIEDKFLEVGEWKTPSFKDWNSKMFHAEDIREYSIHTNPFSASCHNPIGLHGACIARQKLTLILCKRDITPPLRPIKNMITPFKF